MTLSDLEGWDTKGQTFVDDLLNCAPTFWPRATKFGRITGGWGACFYLVRYAPILRGHSLSSPIFGTPIDANTVWTKAAKFAVVTPMGEGRVSGGQTCPHLKGAVPASPKYFGPPTDANMVSARVTKFGTITPVGRGVFLGGQMPHPKEAGTRCPQFFLSPLLTDLERPNLLW